MYESKFLMMKTFNIYDIYELERHYKSKTKGHWFDKDTMRFFNCRLNDNLYFNINNGLIYFVSSEKFDYKSPRLYTVRSYNPIDGYIDTVGEFQAYKSLSGAKNRALKLSLEK